MDYAGSPMVYQGKQLVSPTDGTLSFLLAKKFAWDFQQVIERHGALLDKYYLLINVTGIRQDSEGYNTDYCYGWLPYPIFLEDKLNQGAFKEKIYEGPLLTKPPFDTSALA